MGALTAAIVGKSMVMQPSIAGKPPTFTQLLSVSLVLLDLAQWVDVPTGSLNGVFVATGLASFWSGGGYVPPGMKGYAASEPQG